MRQKIMASKNLLVYLVAVFALVALASGVSAFGNITGVEVSGVPALGTTPTVDFANFAGQKVPILVVFTATENASDVRVKAWFSGAKDNSAVSERFDVLAGRTYTRVAYLDVPFDLKDSLDEPRKLLIGVENRDQTADQVEITFTVERESYRLDILDVNMQSEISAGESLAIDVVLKNTGRKFADDAFLRITIPELGIDTKTYFGDLSPIDQANPDKEDASERRTYVRIPVDAPAGLYTVTLHAYNSDSEASATKRVLVKGVSETALAVPSQTSKTFKTGESAEYKLTLVNRGTTIAVYKLTATAPRDLNVDISDPLVVVPAGSSKTVSIMASSSVRDAYTFSVNVNSEEGTPVSQNTFVANVVEDDRKTTGSGFNLGGTSNATVLLTVILAIIFIVLLVVLIVLLTRKPETKEEFGESYY